MHPIRRTQHGIGVNPSIICHTDHRANQRPQQGIVYDDNRTTVDVLDVFQLRFWPAAYSHPSVPLFVKPTTIIGLHTPIFLLVVRVASTTLGVVKRDVLYFVADNYAFLNQVLVRHSLRLTHMVKVRQGYGFGHINPCLTGSYTTAVHLGLKYLIADNQVRRKDQSIRPVGPFATGESTGFKLKPLTPHFRWSGLLCRGYLVEQVSYPYQNMDALYSMLAEGPMESSPISDRPQRPQFKAIGSAVSKISIKNIHRLYAREDPKTIIELFLSSPFLARHRPLENRRSS